MSINRENAGAGQLLPLTRDIHARNRYRRAWDDPGKWFSRDNRRRRGGRWDIEMRREIERRRFVAITLIGLMGVFLLAALGLMLLDRWPIAGRNEMPQSRGVTFGVQSR